jgi:uncharacterized damage-inducible protein DinB
MTISETLLSEFDQEMASTRKMLECVPEDKFAWKPHEKPFPLSRLASHLAEMPLWAAIIIDGQATKPPKIGSKAELLEAVDKNIAAGRQAITGATDDPLSGAISANPALAVPRVALLRRRVISHLIHHRGQLSVYLRLSDVAVPGMYGPSTDKK